MTQLQPKTTIVPELLHATTETNFTQSISHPFQKLRDLLNDGFMSIYQPRTQELTQKILSVNQLMSYQLYTDQFQIERAAKNRITVTYTVQLRARSICN